MQVIKYAFQQHGDERGQLVALEEFKDIPFEIKRVYYMYDTGAGVRRGFHAHKSLDDLIVVHGRMAVLFGNIHVFCQILAEDEAERRRIAFINAGDLLGLFGRDIPVSCDSHEFLTPH